MGIMFGYMASPLIHQKVFLVINMVFYLVVIIFVIKDYIPFAMNGGLYGASGKQKKGSHGKEAKKIFAKACEGLKENEQWIDKDFPATMDSIKGNGQDRDGTFRKVQNQCDGWIKASEFPGAATDIP